MIKKSYAFILILLTILGIVFIIYQQKNENTKIDDTQRYVIDFSKLFDQQWKISEPYPYFERSDDMAGWVGWENSIIGHTVVGVRNKVEPQASFAFHIIQYSDFQQAHRRYIRQEDWIFVRDRGVPISRQVSSYENLSLPDSLDLSAYEYRVACITGGTNTQCGALLHYREYIVFIDAFVVVNTIRYLSDDDLFNVLEAIDDKMMNAFQN